MLWSKAAVASRWVREEAQEAADHQKLVPAMLDGIAPPMGFRRIHAADLAGWRGDDGHSGWQDLKSAVRDLLAEPIYRNTGTSEAQASEPPRATVRTQFLGSRLSHIKFLMSFVRMCWERRTTVPLWARHAIALLFGYAVACASIYAIGLIVFAALGFQHAPPEFPVILVWLNVAPAAFIGLYASVKLFRKLLPEATTAPRISYLCNRQAVLYCLLLVVVFVSRLISDADNEKDKAIFFGLASLFSVSAAMSGLIAAVTWWRMRRAETGLHPAE